MSRMNCINGFVFVAAMCLGLMVTSAGGGSLDSPAGPESTNSAMFTLNDIYNVLDTHTTNVAKRAGAFMESSGGPTNGTMRTLNDIMVLATNRAPVSKTGQTNSYATDDDGALKLGVAWPNPRFSPVATNGAETNQIRDNLTGLIWARNANQLGLLNWGSAITNCNDLNYGGTNDWRLPSERELLSLIDYRYSSPMLCNTAGTAKWTANDPFTGVVSDWYLSSTTYASGTAAAWYVGLGDGSVSMVAKTVALYVWPVRGGRRR